MNNMRQAFHILRKDVRHLRVEIALTLVAVAGLVAAVAGEVSSAADPGATQGVASAMFTYLVPVAWFSLIARLIYGEPLVGHQAFWLTRPYSRASLLTAKAIFIGLFVNVPKLIADVVVLRVYGFPIWSELSGLLWTQVLVLAVYVLPVVAVCAVTSGFVQLVLATIALALAVAGFYLVMPAFGLNASWLALEWTRSYCAGVVIATAALVIIALQYARKGTGKSRFIGATAVLQAFLILLFLPWSAGFRLQSAMPAGAIDASAIRVGFDPKIDWSARALVSRTGDVDLHIPLRITGVAAPFKVRVDGIAAAIDGPAGSVFRGDREPSLHVRSTGDFVSLYARLDRSFYSNVRNHTVRIHGSAYITVYGNPRRTLLPIQDRIAFHPVPGVGLCAPVRDKRGIVLYCRSSFRSRPDLVTFDVIGRPTFIAGALPVSLLTLSSSRPLSYCPFPAEPDLIPVTQSAQVAVIFDRRVSCDSVSTLALEPVAYIRKSFEITGIRLADYETFETLR